MCSFSRPACFVVASVTALVLAACGDEDGDALPGGQSTTSATQSTAASSVTGGGGGELAKVEACDLLTVDEAATLSKGFAVKDEGALGGASDSCSWDTSVDRGVPIEKFVSVGIDVRPRQTLDQLNIGLGKATDGEVEGRKAKLVTASAGEDSCALSFEAEKGRVDIVVEAKPTDRACEIASKVSTLIEPKLPKPKS